MARTFDGTNDQIAFGSEAALDDLAVFTALAVVRPTATVAAQMQVLTKMDSGYLGKMYVALFNQNQVGCYMNRSGGADCYAFSSNDTVVVNSWNVLAVTWAGTGNAPVLYACTLGGAIANVVGSSQIGSGAFWSDAGATLRLGARDPLDATFYAGGLAECALWNRVLSADELGALGRGFAPAFFPRGRVFYSTVDGRNSPERNWAGTTHGTVTEATYLEHPRVIYPCSNTGVKPSAAAASFSPAWACGSNVLLGVGIR